MHRTKGIILKKLDIGEADALYAIYTEDYGKIKALAQGIRKEEAKLRGHLEPLSLSGIRFIVGRGGEKLIAAHLLNFWPHMRARETTLGLAGTVAAEIDAQCFPGERDEGVWGLLSETFAALDREDFCKDEAAAAFLGEFRGRLRACLGYGAAGGDGLNGINGRDAIA